MDNSDDLKKNQIIYLQQELNKLNEKYSFKPIKEWSEYADKMKAYALVHRLKQLRSFH